MCGLIRGALVLVSWVDNIVRPLVISNATRMPFLLVVFGVLGGVLAFGLVGLFIGPVLLAVSLAIWREWLEEHSPRTSGIARRPASRSSGEIDSRGLVKNNGRLDREDPASRPATACAAGSCRCARRRMSMISIFRSRQVSVSPALGDAAEARASTKPATV